MIRSVLLVLGSYVLAAIPIAFLTGRLLRGVDLRERGSRNVGASNVWQSVSRAAVVPVGLAEIGQGFAGPAAARALDDSPGVQALAGLAALGGHNWSPFLRFSGGRGVGHAIGFMAAVSRPALGVFILFSLLGVLLRAVPQFVGLGIIAAPVTSAVARQGPEVTAGMAGMAGLIFAKRLLSNEPPPAGSDARRVLLYRLLYDRDTRERERWVRGE